MTLADAIRSRDVARLPGRREEGWRWTDLRSVVRAVPELAGAGDAAAVGPGPFHGCAEHVQLVLNGAGAAPILIDAGAQAALQLRFVSQAAGRASAADVRVDVAAGGSLLLLESHEAGADGYVADTTIDVSLGDGARLERVVILGDAPGAVAVTRTTVRLGAGADYAQTVLSRGARRRRYETHVVHPGAGARVRLDGLYALGGEAHSDFTSEVRHAGPGGSTSQLIKGAARDSARGVFQGRIVVDRGADDTEARMDHRALLLSDRAEIDAKPELEIYADAVTCGHGATVGALDEEALFYVRQRGLDAAAARALLTDAFLRDVIDRISNAAARDRVGGWLDLQLQGRP